MLYSTLSATATQLPDYAPLHLIPTFSKWHSAILIFIHALALLIIVFLPLSILIRIALIAITLMLSWLETSLHILRNSPLAIRKAIWNEKGEWTLELTSGKSYSAKLFGDSLVTPFLIILNFRITEFPFWYSLVLTSSNCDPDLLRCLRVRLRLDYSSSFFKLKNRN